jgi:zinc transporter 5/7
VIYWALSWLGVPDHKGGIILLCCGLCLSIAQRSVGRKLAVSLGGAKRLNALSTLTSCVMLSPWAIFQLTYEDVIVSWVDLLFPLLAIILFTFILDFYMESICGSRLDASSLSRITSISSFTAALGLSLLWNHPRFPVGAVVTSDVDHALSPGVIVAYILFVLATRLLTRSSIRSDASKANLIGYTPSGLPLYNFHAAGTMLQRHSQSLLTILKSNLRQILEGFYWY